MSDNDSNWITYHNYDLDGFSLGDTVINRGKISQFRGMKGIVVKLTDCVHVKYHDHHNVGIHPAKILEVCKPDTLPEELFTI